jgi:hypothetical protein
MHRYTRSATPPPTAPPVWAAAARAATPGPGAYGDAHAALQRSYDARAPAGPMRQVPARRALHPCEYSEYLW